MLKKLVKIWGFACYVVLNIFPIDIKAEICRQRSTIFLQLKEEFRDTGVPVA